MQIQLDNVTKRFNRQLVFKNLNHIFQSGHKYAITGANGSGKSTLIQVVIGKIPASKGNITYSSKEGQSIPPEEIFRELSISTTSMSLIEEFSLEELLDFHFKFKKPVGDLTKAEIQDLIELSAEKKKRISDFSSGMKQRLKIGLAILSESSLLVLDEPGANLDNKAKQWFQNLLAQFLGKRTLIIASNDREDYQICDHVLVMEEFKA